jgi:hypothetical protein
MGQIATRSRYNVAIEIGGIPIHLSTTDPAFLRVLEERYAGFVNASARPEFQFQVELVPPGRIAGDEDVRVELREGQWALRRGDFCAEWDPRERRGWIRHSANPYSIDAVLRIVHSILLASEGGFLVHSASAVRRGRAFVFAGRSGAGKTTISRLAPREVTLLSDEISYIRRDGDGYRAFGTPFAGELARLGENVSAPVAAFCLLAKGPGNRMEPVPAAEAARALLRNTLFFAHDAELVKRVFQSAFEFVSRVPVHRLVFAPDERVWEMIG